MTYFPAYVLCVQQMMNHLEDRPRDADWAVVQNNVVKYLLENRGLRDRFKEEEVLAIWKLKYCKT